MIGRAADIWLEPHRLLAKVDFAPTTFAQEVAGLYQAGNMITAPNRAIDVLAVPDTGSAATSIFGSQGEAGRSAERALAGHGPDFGPQDCHRVHVRILDRVAAATLEVLPACCPSSIS